jgi:chromatin remodeling complex protein RSC6
MNIKSNEVNIIQDDEIETNDISDHFNKIIDSLQLFKSQINGLQQQIKVLEKNIKKQMKTLKKESTKCKNKGKRKPSGFAKPSKVTNELCEFMNKKEGTEIARTEVTRTLCSYIKEHKLENTENSKIIAPDNKLKTLLGIEEGQELTYFTIQKYMNKHFI